MISLLKKMSVMVVGLFAVTLMASGTAQAATTNGRIIDDAVFDASASMSANDIQAFLNQFPNSCLKNYTDSMPSSDPTQAYFNYSGTGSVAQIIRRVADVYGVNPRVMLTKLEQEENLVTGNAGCAQWRYASAVGFHCFDGANPRTTVFNGTTIQTCVDRDENMGVARQLTKGMWTLKWGKERANGNLAWMVPDDASITYYGPMTQGTRKRCGNCAAVYYDGYWKGVFLESGATASLYNYTIYLGQAFGSIWEGWWGAGSTSTPNWSSVYAGQSAYPTIQAGQSAAAYVSLKNTGNQVWYDDASLASAPAGTNPIHLATARPVNRLSQLGAQWGGSQNRPALTFAAVYEADGVTLAADQHRAQYGQIARFNFNFVAPADLAAGVYREWFMLVREGSGGGVLNDPGIYLDVTVTDPPLGVTRPVYRSYNPVLNRHFYTISKQERDTTAAAAGYTYEGIAYWVPTAATSTPVYRLYNPVLNRHFFTVWADERDSAARSGYNYEGIAYYSNPSPSGTPIYRLYNPYGRTHFYTVSIDEREAARRNGFNYEGVGFYVN